MLLSKNLEEFDKCYENYLNDKLITIPISKIGNDRIKYIRVNFINGKQVNYTKRTTKKFLEKYKTDVSYRNSIQKIDARFDFSQVKLESYILLYELETKWFSSIDSENKEKNENNNNQ